MSDIRLVLQREDFSRLVRGQEARRHGVAVILADIGWGAMLDEISAAIRGAEPFRAPGERQASAATLLRTWFDAHRRAQVEPDQEAADELDQATEAMLDWCLQEFGDEQEPTEATQE
jgi:hypothetical protein